MAFLEIFNLKLLPHGIATAGQPDEQQLHDIVSQGYDTVINLGLSGIEYAIPNEREILEQSAIRYHHIPVSFSHPDPEQYHQFAQLLKTLETNKIFIHCAANKRASVFVALFDILEKGTPTSIAWQDVLAVWSPDHVWKQFFNAVIQIEQRAANNRANEDA